MIALSIVVEERLSSNGGAALRSRGDVIRHLLNVMLAGI
jgi:hypothetical protein